MIDRHYKQRALDLSFGLCLVSVEGISVFRASGPVRRLASLVRLRAQKAVEIYGFILATVHAAVSFVIAPPGLLQGEEGEGKVLGVCAMRARANNAFAAAPRPPL